MLPKIAFGCIVFQIHEQGVLEWVIRPKLLAVFTLLFTLRGCVTLQTTQYVRAREIGKSAENNTVTRLSSGLHWVHPGAQHLERGAPEISFRART